MTSLRAEVVELQEWNKIVNSLDELEYNINIFHKISCLYPTSSNRDKFKAIIIYDKSKPVIGLPVLIQKKYKILSIATSYVRFIPFLGLFKDNSITIKKYFDSVKIMEYELSKIAHIYRIVNSPLIADIRPFSWRGWHTHVLYTYVLNVNNFDFDQLPKKMRWLIRKGLKHISDIKEVYYIDNNIIREFSNLVTNTLSKKSVNISYNLIVRHIICFMKSNIGIIYVEQDDAHIRAGELFVVDPQRQIAYRIFAASSEYSKRAGIAAALLYESLIQLKNRGIEKVYLLGANILDIAQFIEKYSNYIEPYYLLTKGKGILNYMIRLKY